MHNTLSSKMLCVAATPILFAVAACSSNNNNTPSGDGGTTSASSSTSTSSGSSTSGTSTTGDSGITDAGADVDAASASVFVSTVYAPLLTKCVGCHGVLADGGQGGGLSFGKLDMGDAAAAYENLVGSAGTGVNAAGGACLGLGDAGLKRVLPGDPVHSLLYNKLISNDGDGGSLLLSDGGLEVFCGAPMPYHFPAEAPALIQATGAWIEAGAQP